MQGYLAGWLAFESVDGQAKCRLTPIPHDWESAPADELERLLHLAEPVRGERTSGPQARATGNGDSAERSDSSAAPPRAFHFPNGRKWTVAEWAVAGRGVDGEQRVLRFTAGNRSLDLEHFPSDWSTLSDARLAILLAEGFPRDLNRHNPTTHQRRASDRRA